MKQQKIKSGKINVNIIIIITNLKRKKKLISHEKNNTI